MWNQLLATKSVDSLQVDAKNHSGLKRTLTAFDLTMLGIGVIVGAGIFVVTGRAAAAHAGPAVALSFILAGVAAALAGLCYSEMASMIPVAGSAYTYAYATMGELMAFIIGWDLILEYLVGAALVCVGWSGYATVFLEQTCGIILPAALTGAPLAWDDATQSLQLTGAVINLPAALLALLLTVILVIGIRESARANTAVVFVKLFVVFLFIAFGAQHINVANWHPFIPENAGTFGQFGVSGIFQGASIVFLAYIGFDTLSTVAQETRNPQRDLPIGILASLAICTVLYVAVSLVLTGLVSYHELSVANPIAVGVAATGERWLATAVNGGAIAGLSSGALVMLMGQPRLFFAMGQDGLLPAFATRIHPRFGTPYISTIGTGCACAVASAVLPIEVLGGLVSIGTLFAFVLVSLSVMILRIRRPAAPRIFRVPGGAFLVPLSSALISGALMVASSGSTLWRLFGWMALGLAFYFGYSRRHSKLAATRTAASRR